MIKLSKKDFLSIIDLKQEEFFILLKRATDFKVSWNLNFRPQPLLDKNIALIFQKPSMRTRVSFEVGIKRLGGSTIFIDYNSQFNRYEPLKDVARVMSRYVDALVVRTFDHQTIEELAYNSSIPVINALTNLSHPCQVLSDLFTINERLGDVRTPVYAWIGDSNNMTHSWLEAAGVLGLDLRLACPRECQPSIDLVEKVRDMGARLTITNNPHEAITGAQVISTDVWISMGGEALIKNKRAFFNGYTLDTVLLSYAAPNSLVLHCLPACRGQEISDEVLEGSQSIVWDQVENRLYMQMAIMEALII